MVSIKFSKRAKRDLVKILDYLSKNWSNNVSIEFIDKFEKLQDQICSMPYSFLDIKIKSLILKRAKITKHNAVYFSVDSKTISILAIHDTRTKNIHPNKLK
jgi:plasmid stabilization system protein ParE